MTRPEPPASAGGANLLAADLDHVLEHTSGLWEELRGGRVFITGGTGFFGCWMLESLVWANDRLSLGAEAVVLTRHPERFVAKAPHLALAPGVELLPGEVKSYVWPEGRFTHLLHLATETEAEAGVALSLASFETALQGTARVLGHARTCGVAKMLLASSGAVYGPQPPDCLRLAEDHTGGPDSCDASAGYAHGKRAAEFLCSVAAEQWGLQAKIARCFAFVGPYMSLDANFAIGNFIRDALHGGPVRVTGDGTPYRSYLYAADLAIWLWRLLCDGEAGRPYNVGSPDALSIREMAELVAAVVGAEVTVEVAGESSPNRRPERYVPDTSRSQTELGLEILTPLDDAIARTARWYDAKTAHR